MRGVASTAGTRMVVLVLGLGSTVALARGLGPTGRGVYALAMTLATLGVVALNFGFHTANTYFASRERETLPALISNTFALALLAVAIVFGATLATGSTPLQSAQWFGAGFWDLTAGGAERGHRGRSRALRGARDVAADHRGADRGVGGVALSRQLALMPR